MFGLSRFMFSARTFARALKHKPGRACVSASCPQLDVVELEDRVVPTLLGQQLFPSDNPWNQNISNAPVASNSAAIIAHIGSSIKLHPDWGADSSANGSDPLYGIPINIVHGNSTATVNVTITNYPGSSDIEAVPMPANPVIEGDYQNGPNLNGAGYGSGQRGDSHLIIWDEDNNIAYEFYLASRPTDKTNTSGKWEAAQETVWNMNTDTFRTLGYTSADAAGLSVLAGLVRPDEGLPVSQGGQGAIDHAIRFTLPSGDINPQYVYPASHEVNVSSQASDKLPMGARLRLANTPAVNALIAQMGPESQAIATAMQQYGLILADDGSAMYVTGTSASVDANNNIALTWNLNDIFASDGLGALTAGDFQVLNLTPVVSGLSTTSAAPGSTITVNGQNFSGAAGHISVLFGTTAATSVTVVSDTQLSVVVPNGSGTVNVTVQSGVNETDHVSDNPNANVNAPIFGYGTSATSSADQFTFGSSSTGASSFAVSAPSTATAGSSFSVTVTARTSSGVTDTSYTGTVKFTSTDALAGLPANYTFTAADAGVHTFTVTLKPAGSQSVTATDTTTGSVTGSASTTVSAAAASVLSVSDSSTATAGTAFNVTVTAEDAFGNVATGYTGTVQFTSTDGQAVLPANYTFTGADAGTHTFSVTLETAGSESVTATDTTTGSITGSASTTVSAAPASTLSVSAPSTATAGTAFNVTVTAKDAYGNTATGYTGTVKFTSSDGQAVLPANYTFTNATPELTRSVSSSRR